MDTEFQKVSVPMDITRATTEILKRHISFDIRLCRWISLRLKTLLSVCFGVCVFVWLFLFSFSLFLFHLFSVCVILPSRFSFRQEASFNKKSVTDVNGGFVYCVKFQSFIRIQWQVTMSLFARDTHPKYMAFIYSDMYHYLNHNAQDVVWCHFVENVTGATSNEWMGQTEKGREEERVRVPQRERNRKRAIEQERRMKMNGLRNNENRLLQMWYVSRNVCGHNFEMVLTLFFSMWITSIFVLIFSMCVCA